MLKLIRGQKGQTAIEYVFMLIVVVTMMYSVMGMVKNFLVTESGECGPSDEALVCRMQRVLRSDGGFRYFKLIGAE